MNMSAVKTEYFLGVKFQTLNENIRMKEKKNDDYKEMSAHSKKAFVVWNMA